MPFTCIKTTVLADERIDGEIDAASFLQTGRDAAERENFDEAIGQFEKVLATSEDPHLLIDAHLNIARANLSRSDATTTIGSLNVADELLTEQNDTAWKARRLAVLGELYHRTDHSLDQTVHLQHALDALEQSLEISRTEPDARTESIALGNLGNIAERFGDRDRALTYTRLAIGKAQQAGALNKQYQWQWQAARVLEATGRNAQAITAYRQAIDTLESVRPELTRSSTQSFERAIAPLFFGMAELLLNEHAREPDRSLAQQHLRDVQDTIERFRIAEVQNYFHEECVFSEDYTEGLDELAHRAAIMYPIIFADRLEVLTSIGGNIRRHTVGVGRDELSETISVFRQELTIRPAHGYRTSARRLYDWIVRPMLDNLRDASVDTLVFVPDGPLRNIPPAALYDGEKFLIEEFAVTSSLGLSLTSPQPIEPEALQVLAGGLTVARGGFGALPAVDTELNLISGLFDATELRNERFMRPAVSEELSGGGYSIVHIATHGKFKADYRESFILAYDGRVTMDALQDMVGARKYRNRPVELLMLSACETAVGDDRAALGLAGIALKAGARSAVATLWAINDDATAKLVGDFYTQLRNPALSKAQALQRAQVSLLKQEEFGHPALWSPYLLVGNWL